MDEKKNSVRFGREHYGTCIFSSNLDVSIGMGKF